MVDEETVTVSEIFLRKGSRIEYEYDFGDGWMHDIVSMGKMKQNEPLFDITGGARACPPEDCGGIWGYQELLEALRNELHPEHDSFKEWVGDDFDPEAFDREHLNQRLRLLLNGRP